MTDRLDLPTRHREQVEALLREHVPQAEVWAYGSRVNGMNHEASDLDLVLRGPDLAPIPTLQLTDLTEAFRHSNIPILVEARDWARLPESFHDEIERNYVVMRRGSVPKDQSVSNNWPTVRLDDAIEVNPKRPLTRGTQAPFVAMADIKEHCRSLAASQTKKYKGSGARFINGDTLLARITPCLENGKTALVTDLPKTATAFGSTELIVLCAREGLTDPLFVYYLARFPFFRSYMINQMTGTSGRQRVPINAVKTYRFPLPPLEEQRRIASFLGALDDKIELNRRMNETLEEMARALFKSWFVDFDPVRAKMEGRWRSGESLPGLPAELYDLFPDRLVPSVLGPIPQGWQVEHFGYIAQERRRNVKARDIDQDTPYIALTHMPQRSIALSEWTKANGIASGKFKFNQGELLFGRLRPYFHKVGVAPINGVCSTDIAVVSPRSPEWFGCVLGHLSSTAFVNYTESTSTGTRMPRTSWKTMALYKVALPPCTLANALTEHSRPLTERIIDAIQEKRTLCALRDTLLPSLVSGQLRLADMETVLPL